MKTKNILTAFVMAAFLVASCAKEATPATQENINSDTPEQEQGGVVVNPDGTFTLTFTSEATSKTSLASDGKTVDWVAGDAIRFWGGETYYGATAQSSAHNTAFSDITVPEELSALYVTYPAHIASECEDGTLSISFPSTRTAGEFAGADYSAAKAVKTDGVWNTSLHFKNIASLLQISITDNEITQISVEGLDGEAMAGTLPVSFNASGDLAFGEVASASTKVNLSVDGAGEYFIPVIPGTVSNGFRVTMLKGSATLTPFTFVGAYTLAAGQITKLADVDQHNGQFYVTPSGSGLKGGSGWNNAMSADQFKAFVENGDNHFLVRGATFHFSADEFTFGNYVQPDFAGHSEVNFTLEGTRSGSAMTTFIGGSGDPAGMLWPKSSTNVTVKNVKFTGTDGNSNRAAIRVNTSSAKLSLDHCVFESNKTAGNAGAVYLNKGLINITDCEFTSNSAALGAALFIEQPTVTVTGCTFTSNTASSTSSDKGGGAIYLNGAGATVTIDDCTFTGNQTTNQCGAAICAPSTATSNSLTITNSTFTGNYAKGWGGAILHKAAGSVTISDCTFSENHSGGDSGAINLAGTDTDFTLTRVTFNANYAGSDHGGVMWLDPAKSYTFTDCTFTGNYSAGSGKKGGAVYLQGTGMQADFIRSTFKGNHTSGTGNGGAINAGCTSGNIRFDKCCFDGNYGNRGAALASDSGANTVYFNDCLFTGNYITGKAGTTLFSNAGNSSFFLNNCTFADDTYITDGSGSGNDCCWIYLNASKLVLSNSTLIGYSRKGTNGSTYSGGSALIHWWTTTADVAFINSIVAHKNTNVGNAAFRDRNETVTLTSVSSKTSGFNISASSSGTDATNFYGTSSYFGGLSYVSAATPAWNNCYWSWNGTLATGSNLNKDTADNIKSAIQAADSDFYDWLLTVEGLSKDGRGNARPASGEWWPGAYQN